MATWDQFRNSVIIEPLSNNKPPLDDSYACESGFSQDEVSQVFSALALLFESNNARDL